jgi:hypothetical protein
VNPYQMFRVKVESSEEDFPIIDVHEVRDAVENEIMHNRRLSGKWQVSVEQVDPSGRILDVA